MLIPCSCAVQTLRKKLDNSVQFCPAHKILNWPHLNKIRATVFNQIKTSRETKKLLSEKKLRLTLHFFLFLFTTFLSFFFINTTEKSCFSQESCKFKNFNSTVMASIISSTTEDISIFWNSRLINTFNTLKG